MRHRAVFFGPSPTAARSRVKSVSRVGAGLYSSPYCRDRVLAYSPWAPGVPVTTSQRAGVFSNHSRVHLRPLLSVMKSMCQTIG